MSRPFRLGVVFTHPTQHHSPLWRQLSTEPDIDITVMYLSAENTIKGKGDVELGATEPWDVDFVGGYKSIFLKDITGTVLPKVKKNTLTLDLVKILSPNNFDAVYLSSFVTYSHRLAFLICKLRGIPIISQNDATIMSETGYYNLSYRALVSILYPYLYGLTDYWLTTGNHNEIYLRKYGVPQDKIFTSTLPFDRKRFEGTIKENAEEVRKIREALTSNPDAVLYGFTGKYIERKNPFDFIDAIKKAHQKNPNVKGVLIGGGKLADKINNEISKSNGCLINVGFVNQSKLPLYYAAMDVFVCPSSLDSHPLVVSESMAAGCPVILSDRCGNWGYTDILQHKYNGLVYPCGDINGLADAIIALSDKNTREQYSQKAKEVVSKHDLDRTVESFRGVVEKIKNSHNKV